MVRSQQQGFFLIIAVILMLVLGFMGTAIIYMMGNRAQLSAAELNGFKAFYLAESGIETTMRYLTRPMVTSPARITCSSVTGNAQLTNASLLNGTFTATAINNTPYYSVDTLNAAITATATTLTVSNSSGFAPRGRIVVDREQIDYAGISGNTFVGLMRGVNDTLASSHIAGAGVAQYQCSIKVDAGYPSIAAPDYKRTLQASVQLPDGFVVGAEGSNQFTFSRINYPTEFAFTFLPLAAGANASNLYAISMVSSADGWAVGDANSTTVEMVRWNGTAWVLNTLSSPCSGVNLRGVSMVSAQQGWAVGVGYSSSLLCSNLGSYRYGLLYWNGSNWSFVTPTTTPSSPANTTTKTTLNAVSVIDTTGNGLGNVGFAVGNGGIILRYNGSNWVTSASPVTTDLNGVYTVSTTEAWAVGDSGVILRWNGTTWAKMTSPVTTQLNAIAMFDKNGDGIADAGWIAGASERILSYNGSTWTLTDLGGSNLTGVAISNINDVMVVGAGGLAVHWDGSTWTDVSAATTRNLNAISLIPPGSNPVSGWSQVFE